jgi:hypothetical protein
MCLVGLGWKAWGECMRALPGRGPNSLTFEGGGSWRPADTTIVRLRYAIGGILVAAVLALPASAAAGQGAKVSSLAAQQCARERADVGKRAFRKQFILDNAFDEDTVENAMSECLADTVDQSLNPEDWVDDGSDDEE